MNPNEATHRAHILTLLTKIQDRVMQCELDLLHADYDDANTYSHLSVQLDALQEKIKHVQIKLKEDPLWNSPS